MEELNKDLREETKKMAKEYLRKGEEVPDEIK